jgi:mannose-6-phosphate isomerase
MIDLNNIDKSNFQTEPYVKKVEKPWGYELHFVPEGEEYMGKVEHIDAGKRMSLQIHDEKVETYLLIKGRAKLVWENNKGELIETELEPFKGYTCEVGRKHRLCGISDCDIIEAATPEKGTTLRLEDDYSRPDETPEQRKKERGE